MQILEKSKFVKKDVWICTEEAKSSLLEYAQELFLKYGVDKSIFDTAVVVLGELTDDPSVSIMCHAKVASPIEISLVDKLRSEFREKYPDIEFNIY